MRRKQYNNYKLYTREEMSEIAKKEGYLFVETSRGDYYEIRKKDAADFIMLEANRCGHAVDIYMYVPNPNIQEPFVTTRGYFLDKINQKFRKEIIDRLIELQTTDKKARKVKIFDNDIFCNMTLEELGEVQQNNGSNQYDKFYKSYFKDELEQEEQAEF